MKITVRVSNEGKRNDVLSERVACVQHLLDTDSVPYDDIMPKAYHIYAVHNGLGEFLYRLEGCYLSCIDVTYRPCICNIIRNMRSFVQNNPNKFDFEKNPDNKFFGSMLLAQYNNLFSGGKLVPNAEEVAIDALRSMMKNVDEASVKEEIGAPGSQENEIVLIASYLPDCVRENRFSNKLFEIYTSDNIRLKPTFKMMGDTGKNGVICELVWGSIADLPLAGKEVIFEETQSDGPKGQYICFKRDKFAHLECVFGRINFVDENCAVSNNADDIPSSFEEWNNGNAIVENHVFIIEDEIIHPYKFVEVVDSTHARFKRLPSGPEIVLNRNDRGAKWFSVLECAVAKLQEKNKK